METITRYRPAGPTELGSLEATGRREFPSRLPEQPIFYPLKEREVASGC